MTPSEPKRGFEELANAVEVDRAERHLRLLRGGLDPEPAPPQMPRPSRAQRRAAQAAHRREHNRAVQHECILQRDAVAAGAAIELDEREQHAFHVARGEAHCPACVLCRELARVGKKSTHMPKEVREAYQKAWEAKLRWHSSALGVACLLSFFGGYGATQAKNEAPPESTS